MTIRFSFGLPLAMVFVLTALGALIAARVPVFDDSQQSDPIPLTAAKQKPAAGPVFDKTHIEGHRLCFDCHRSEVYAWQHSKHSSAVFEMLRGEPAEKYAQAMDIRATDIATSSMCVNCHGTPRVDRHGRAKPIAGVACEACHNPSGGADGWLNAHAVYGPPGTSRYQETADHYQMRAERCRTAGQIRSTDLYQMIKRCYECHLISNEKLVNEAGHKLFDEGFEPLKHMLGDVRHNFHLDQRQNELLATLSTDALRHFGRDVEDRKRMIYVVGQLVGAELMLRSAAGAKSAEDDYATGLGDLLLTASDNLFAAFEDLDDFESLNELVEEVVELGEQITDGELDIENTAPLIEAADKLAAAAKEIAAGDSSELTDVPDDVVEITKEELDKAYKRQR